MLSVLISWMIILGISLILGYGIIYYGYKANSASMEHLDIYVICGLMIVNVYAEFFSLFYKVGAKACLGLLIIGIAMCLYYHISTHGECWRIHVSGMGWYKWVVVLLIGVATLIWTVGYPQHYDTSLYHYQAIKWIEEYGVVPGLGNLHNRFAYNSAFMPLQALFSFEWLIGQSLHTVNGFLCFFFLSYAAVTNRMWEKKKPVLSDLLKIATFIYIWYNRSTISSPSSDTLTMLLILYICTKWSEFAEENIEDEKIYGFLCILCVYAVSVKLSAAVCVILVVWSAVRMIRKRRTGLIAAYIIWGIVIIAPWLIRNVIISGYLLYPYPQIDLFNVDWKMPASVLTYDSREIMVWGRRVFEVEQYGKPIWEWFPKWFMETSPFIVTLGIIGTIGCVISMFIKVKNRKGDIKRDILGIYGVVAIIAWLFSAPLIRYGMVYVLIPVCICIADLMERDGNKKFVIALNILLMLVLIPTGAGYMASIEEIGDRQRIRQEDYEWRLTTNRELKAGIKVWLPTEGDQSSADVFPCVPYGAMLDKIELRGDSLKEGFRMKAEYKDMHLNEYGYEW